MKSLNKTIDLQTKEELEFTDVTDRVLDFAAESKIKNGLVNIQSLHTTAAIIVNENEPLLIEDFKRDLKEAVKKDRDYKHDDFTVRTVNMSSGECVNGYAHCRAIRLPVSVVLNLVDGKLQLGRWQRIFLLELDRPKQRKFQIQIIGE